MSTVSFTEKSYGPDVNILKRGPFKAIPLTLDFSSVSAKVDGVKVVKAGTPIGKTGVADNTATALGILLHDVFETYAQGAIVVEGFINETVAEANSGVEYATAMKSALTQVVFE